jgi:antitoxin PrlF
MAIATITSKGQITLPKEIRSRLNLKPGEKIDFRVDEETGMTVLIPLNKHVDEVFGMLHCRKGKKTVRTEDMDEAISEKFRLGKIS